MVNHAQAAQEKGVAQHAAMAGSFFRHRCRGWSNIHTRPVLSTWKVKRVETALAGSNLMNSVKSGKGWEG